MWYRMALALFQTRRRLPHVRVIRDGAACTGAVCGAARRGMSKAVAVSVHAEITIVNIVQYGCILPRRAAGRCVAERSLSSTRKRCPAHGNAAGRSRAHADM